MVSSAVASRDDMKSTSICGSMTFSIWYNCIPWANQPAAFRNAFMIDALLAPLQNKEGDINQGCLNIDNKICRRLECVPLICF
jgi:hypothetical protein